jgi:hypothetical protein
VPSKALKGEVKLPIVNWIYGGAYLLGSKEGMYDGKSGAPYRCVESKLIMRIGTPIVKASGGNVIYVAGNYRVLISPISFS